MSHALDVARNDFRNARRAKLVWGVIGIYVAFAALLFYAGSTGSSPDVSETLFVQVFVTALVLPLVAIAATYLAVAGERESDTITFVLSRPVARRDVVVGKLVSRLGILALALAGVLVVGLLMAAALYPSLEAANQLKFVALTGLLVAAYAGATIGISAATATRSRAIAGAVGFYFLSDVLFLFGNVSVVGMLRYVLEEFGGVQLAETTYEFVRSLSPAQAYLNSTLEIFNPSNFQQIQVPGELPFYLEPWFMVVILLAWAVVPVALGAWAFGRADIG